MATDSMAQCKFRGHRLAVSRTWTGTYTLGIDGWLVGTATTSGHAIATIAESLRMRTTTPDRVAPTLPKRFREAVAVL